MAIWSTERKRNTEGCYDVCNHCDWQLLTKTIDPLLALTNALNAYLMWCMTEEGVPEQVPVQQRGTTG